MWNFKRTLKMSIVQRKKSLQCMNNITSGIVNSLFQPCKQKADHQKPNVQVFNVTQAKGKQINMQIPTALLVDRAFIDVKVSENLTVCIPEIKSDHVQGGPKVMISSIFPIDFYSGVHM